MGELIGLVAVCIPIVAILSGISLQKTKMRAKMVKDQLELERLKHDNFLIETEKMKLELEKLQIENTKNDLKI
ncbi:hypothetical protein [Bacillus sp. FJAT-29814]|uniref:hypothetical protein n=1 Tax=Bacillus sp. FJAT-29814 TaxID=1729688 RepID=UPI0008308BCC|nr:hypothetical protein [Bacillus sp. FJAT-29814]